MLRKLVSKKMTGMLRENPCAGNYKTNAFCFLNLETIQELYRLLELMPVALEKLINKPLYKQFNIPKKKGGMRIIYAPCNELKEAQKIINYYLQAVYLFKKPQCSHGFIIKPLSYSKTHNIVSNAKEHTNSKFVMNIDLQDFFPSISAKRVMELFKSKPFYFNDDISLVLALLCTYQKQLPTGAPTSPVISNFICYEMDKQLTAYCHKNKISYTRYADDLSFSANNSFAENSISAIRCIIEKNNFIINEKKFRIRSAQGQQTVTGIIVNRGVNVNRKYIRNVRAIMHHWGNEGIDEAVKRHFNLNVPIAENDKWKFARKMDGKINFLGMVRGKTDHIYINLKQCFGKRMSESFDSAKTT